MDKKECKIIQDLLPNYIDNLTTPETNEFIENHLKQCSECTKMLENMKKDFGIEEKPEKKNFKNFMKKYRNKLRIFKLIVLAIIVIFLLMLDRKAMIMIGLTGKSNYSVTHKSVYRMTYRMYDSYQILNIGVYVNKDENRYVRELSHTSDYYDNKFTIREISDGETSNYYIKSGENKKAILNAEQEGIKPVKIEDYYFGVNDNKTCFIRNLFMSSVSKNNNAMWGNSCYYFSNFAIPGIGICDVYVEKDTGLMKTIVVKESYSNSIASDAIIEISNNNPYVVEEVNLEEYEIVDETIFENLNLRG